MAFFTLGEAATQALGGGSRKPSPAPHSLETSYRLTRVLRGSVEAGKSEEAFFRVPAKGETDHLLRIARRTLDAGRRLRRDARAGARSLTATERAIAALTSGAVRVYEEILTLARLNRGRVFPTYEHLAHATGLGRATIARALSILKAIGFLGSQRRFKRIVVAGLGTRYAQTSNMYRALLPTKVLPYLPRWMRPVPHPDDDAQRRCDDASVHRSMVKSLSCRALAETTIDGPLGRILAKLGAAIDRACESQNEPKALTNPTGCNDRSNAIMRAPCRG